MTTSQINDELREENELLRLRLEEAEAVVEAIRNGIVDAVIVGSTLGEKVYTLEGADRPYRRLVEVMQQGVAVLDSEGVFLYCNPCLTDLFEVSVESVTGHSADAFVSKADHAVWAEMVRNVAIHPSQREVQLCRQNGRVFPASISLTSLPLQNVCLLVTDLSQQKTYEELLISKLALRGSEIRYRRLFETAKDGILILDSQTGRITDANPFMSELLGYTINHFSGKELWEIGLFSDKTANEAAVRELQDKGYIRYDHLPLETSTGRRVEVEVVANSYREDEHSVIQCNIRDITERSQLEAERNRLEIVMREQSVALEDLHRRKDEFLAMLSHELRNPLSPIASALQLLSLQKNEDRLQHQARTIIERQVGQLTRLIDDLLEVSRITTGRIHLQQAQFVLNRIVENAIETVRPLIDRHKHGLTISLSTQPIRIYADAARLEQVVVNLLTNAAKFTHDGGQIEVEVNVECQQANGDWTVASGEACDSQKQPTANPSMNTAATELVSPFAVIRVRDSGVGIAKDLLPCIFDLFTQAERSLDRSQGGLGIGLALVQSIVEMHKGMVEVTSVLEQGSEFVVRIPLMAAPATQASSPHKGSIATDDRSLKILVVDDNVDAAEMLGMLLLFSGHEVLTVHDGPSSLDAAFDFIPDVVLLDIGLPGMDGYEVATKLRQEKSFKSVVLIAMTGYGQDSDRQRSREAGFDHHLVKPPDFAMLEQILKAVSVTT